MRKLNAAGLRRAHRASSGIFLALLAALTLPAPRHASGQFSERLDRGVIALAQPDGSAYLAWRLLASDPPDVAFDLFRWIEPRGEREKLNDKPIVDSCNFIDATAAGKPWHYVIRPVSAGKPLTESDPVKLDLAFATRGYVSIKLEGDHLFDKVALADLNGDGKLDFIVKQPNQVTDPGVWRRSVDTFKIEAYLHDGTFLWRKDLGWNIEQGIWYSPMIAYDFDGDGRAEIAVKTAPMDEDHRNDMGRVLDGPEYCSVLDGMTGEEIARVDWPPRGDITEWGDKTGNRASRHLIGMAYLDGKKPSLIVLRGTYTKMFVDAYNLVDRKLVPVWKWSGDEEDPPVRGQGMHGMIAVDLDDDGRDEIVLGAAVLDDDGTVLWNLGMGHPDAVYIADILPERPGLELIYGFESAQKRNGFCLVEARTGKIIWGNDFPTTHIHSQGLFADIDPDNPGFEFYGGEKFVPDRWMFSARDGKLLSREDFGSLSPTPLYWDDTGIKAIAVRGKISKYNGPQLGAYQGRVVGLADVFGDWREELIVMAVGEIRIYPTTIPATTRRVCLMQDRLYRTSVALQAMGYFYPPQLGGKLFEAPAEPIGPDAPAAHLPDELAWPAITREARPWTRWWWMGSAVDRENLTRELTLFQEAGLGGVEICPIYGAKGHEHRSLDFLSPQWMEMLAHTTTEGRRLGLGVDMTTGTGWPFGGPFVPADDASARLNLQRYELNGGQAFTGPLPKGRLQALLAVSEGGERVDLTRQAGEGRISWVAPPGEWKLYAAAMDGPTQKVKRPAPGGAGNVLDPYSVTALRRYLGRFDEAFQNPGAAPRAHFHDSFEYFGAQWTPGFLREFEARRGYDLQAQFPALFGDGPRDTVARVKSDYRETIFELHLDYVRHWTEWARSRGSLTRNQAHGAPGNLIDLYAAVDIPETEIFGAIDEKHLPMQKFASSAAHLSGRTLASAESFTWLNEHFQTTLAEVKHAADYLFLSGVNHIFFHGIPFSPADAPWPGWQFYASVNFGPGGGLWRDLPHFNAYAARCQSILQNGRPANDVLLYFPLHDIWHEPEGLLMPFTVHNVEKWLSPHPVFQAAMTLWDRGYAYDHLSDRFLENARWKDGAIVLGGNRYRAVLVPKSRVMPETTARKLVELAREGATLLIEDQLPADVPGWASLEQRRAALQNALAPVRLADTAKRGVRRAAVGQGAVLVGTDIESLLQQSGLNREPLVDHGIRFVRRTHPDGHHYFLANRGAGIVDDWVTLGTAAEAAAILDPRFEDRTGMAALRKTEAGTAQVRLRMLPGESLILRTFAAKRVHGRPWNYLEPAGAPHPLTGTWRVDFIEGGPELPPPFTTREPGSWTTAGSEAARFAGTARYTLAFEQPERVAEEWVLDLGQVFETARVRLNGREIGALWCPPYQIALGDALQSGRNTLEIEVTNLAANRIADLDRRGVTWKYFHDINVVNVRYKALDASDWPPRTSGLAGPVLLHPMRSQPPRDGLNDN